MEHNEINNDSDHAEKLFLRNLMDSKRRTRKWIL